MNIESRVFLEVDEITRADWNLLINTFSDATYLQTWEYGTCTWGEQNVSHAVLKLDGRSVAAAQVGTVSPVPGLKYANISHGPMWRTKEIAPDCRILDLIIRELTEEYVRKRGCSLRVFPFIHDGEPIAEESRKILSTNGFECSEQKPKTLFLDLSIPLDELRTNLRKRWRQYLNHAERVSLEVLSGNSEKLLAECLQVYREMHGRKHFSENVRMRDFLALHEILPENYKFSILAIRKNENIGACLVWSAIGDTCVPVLGATAASGLENRASYLAWWEMIKRLQVEGIHWLDFRGIDPAANPGVYTFKTGMSGKRGLEVCYLGDFVRYHSKLACLAITAARKIRSCYEYSRSNLRRFYHRNDAS